MWKSVIAHIDADCFYVSCERARTPSLIGKPVAVLGNQGACVIAKSYEMKPYGVKVGMPIWEAQKLCPEGIYVKRDFAWYGAVSKKMLGIFKLWSPSVEYYSVDEVFIDFTEIQHLYEYDWEQVGRGMQRQIQEEVGIPMSVGISLTRTLAKLASDKYKPRGMTVIGPEQVEHLLKTSQVEELTGIGTRLMHRVNREGIYTCMDYANTPRPVIERLVHAPGAQLWWELHGVVSKGLTLEKPQQKIISRGGSIGKRSSGEEVLWAYTLRNLDRLVEALFQQRTEIGGVGLALETDENEHHAYLRLPDFAWQYEDLLPTVRRAFSQAFRANSLYRSMHLIGMPIRSQLQKQLTLFPAFERQDSALDSLKRAVNTKYGPHSLRSGATIAIEDIYRDKAQDFEICDIQGKLCF